MIKIHDKYDPLKSLANLNLNLKPNPGLPQHCRNLFLLRTNYLVISSIKRPDTEN